MKRPLQDKRPFGPFIQDNSDDFNQFDPSDTLFTLDYILDDGVVLQKVPIQENSRINIQANQVEAANISPGDVLKVRIFPTHEEGNVMELVESSRMTKEFEDQPQAIYGVVVQEGNRVNIPHGTMEMLNVEVGDTLVMIAEKVEDK